MKSTRKQTGATLLVSMVILLVLTVIGIASMGNSSMETNMAHNFRLSTVAFQMSETAIETVIAMAILGVENEDSPAYSADEDIIDKVLNAATSQTATYTAADLDPETYLDDAAPQTRVDVDELRFIPADSGGGCAGSSGACREYTITASTTLANSGATATHTQVVSILMPE